GASRPARGLSFGDLGIASFSVVESGQSQGETWNGTESGPTMSRVNGQSTKCTAVGF
ncbi:12395_t:CDS:2, partial [Acaulospora colombiana]